MFESTLSRLDLKLEPHPHQFEVAWVDKTSLLVKEGCLVPLMFGLYLEDIYCDALPMNIAHFLLRCPWLYNHAI